MATRLMVLVLVLASLGAGCLSDVPDLPGSGGEPGVRPGAAVLMCYDAVCNFEATVEPETRQANELSIAVNPTDPLNIIATGKDYTPDEAGECVWDGLYATHDGGRTWTNMNVPGSNWRRLADPTYPPHSEFSKFWCATDPVVAFGPDGTAYWTVMPYQCDAASGSKTGRGVLPQGGFNDWFWTCSSMYVLVSEDGGDTWPIVQEVAFGPRLEHDKQWLTVAPNGNVLLCWDRDTEYVGTGTAADQLNPGGNTIVCAVSSDKGRSWSEPADANAEWAGFLPWVDYGGDNVAWLAAINGTHVLVASSSDGLSWAAPSAVATYENPEPGGEYGWPVLAGSDFRTFTVPSLAVDRSAGPYGGSIYVVWFDHSTGDGEVLLAFSRDGGATWSTPARVHDDAPDSGFDQFMPAVAVGPDGTVDVSWYDRRDDPDNHLFRLYYAYSLDGGATFSVNTPVADVLSDEQFSHHQNGMVFMGDYLDIDSSAGAAHVVWVDTRNRLADVFIATLERPGANPD